MFFFKIASLAAPFTFQLTLIKDNRGEDFGFSLSDGQMERGVFVHTVRPNGPAHRAGLSPYDRILQVSCYEGVFVVTSFCAGSTQGMIQLMPEIDSTFFTSYEPPQRTTKVSRTGYLF